MTEIIHGLASGLIWSVFLGSLLIAIAAVITLTAPVPREIPIHLRTYSEKEPLVGSMPVQSIGRTAGEEHVTSDFRLSIHGRPIEGASCTVGDYLLTRLKQIGVDHLFGMSGDSAPALFKQVLESDIQYVGMCNELNAAYAADGYARLKAIGAFATNYAVGDPSALNGVAGAYDECVPAVAITGAPSPAHFRTRPLLHHTLGDYQFPRRIYEHVTVGSTHLSDGETTPAGIAKSLALDPD
jgi:hypothetical protein